MLKGIRECTREPVLWRTEDHGSKKPRTSVKDTWCARLVEKAGELWAQLAWVLGLLWLAEASRGLLPAPGALPGGGLPSLLPGRLPDSWWPF